MLAIFSPSEKPCMKPCYPYSTLAFVPLPVSWGAIYHLLIEFLYIKISKIAPGTFSGAFMTQLCIHSFTLAALILCPPVKCLLELHWGEGVKLYQRGQYSFPLPTPSPPNAALLIHNVNNINQKFSTLKISTLIMFVGSYCLHRAHYETTIL